MSWDQGTMQNPPPLYPQGNNRSNNRTFIVVICVVIFALVAFMALGIGGAVLALVMSNQQAETQKESIDYLKSVEASDLEMIFFSEENGRPIRLFSDKESIASFVEAVHATEAYAPNHPIYTQEIHLGLYCTKGESLNIEIHTKHGDGEVVFMYFVQKHGAVTKYLGTAQCDDLYVWMKEQGLLESPINEDGQEE